MEIYDLIAIKVIYVWFLQKKVIYVCEGVNIFNMSKT